MLERFDRYMERCLYDPARGFYSSGSGSAGRRGGDFLTSPEVGPLFADVLSNALDEWWVSLGRPDPFLVYDAGTGPGTLVRGLERSGGSSASARRLSGFDRALRSDAGASTAGESGPPPRLDGAIVIANELLDNLPFRIFERSETGWSEVFVVTDGDAAPVEVLQPADPPDWGPLAGLADGGPLGVRIPILDHARAWVSEILDRGAAMIVAFDYGAVATAELAERGGWLRTYREHQRGHDPYLEPGRWDITTDVAFDQLPPPDDVIDQASALRRWGIDDLVDEGRRYWVDNAAVPDVKALRMRSRIGEAEALLNPAGLGSWLVAIWTGAGRPIPPP